MRDTEEFNIYFVSLYYGAIIKPVQCKPNDLCRFYTFLKQNLHIKTNDAGYMQRGVTDFTVDYYLNAGAHTCYNKTSHLSSNR